MQAFGDIYLMLLVFSAICMTITIVVALRIGDSVNLKRQAFEELRSHIEYTNTLIEKRKKENDAEAVSILMLNQINNFRKLCRVIGKEQ